MKRLRLARDGYFLISALFCLTAFIHLFLPELTADQLCRMGGILLITYGVIKIVGYTSDDLYCLAFQFDLASGLLLLVVGVLLLALNVRIYPYLYPGLGLLILLDALLKIQTSRDAKRFGLKTWYMILITAVVAGILGVLIIIRPFHRNWLARGLCCSGLLAEGIMNYLVVRKTVKNMKKNISS